MNDHEQSESIGSSDGDAAGEDSELVEGVIVLAETRTIERVREGPPPFVQVAAVAATGFVAGAATAAVLGRHFSRAQARRGASVAPALPDAPRSAHQSRHVVASQRFIVDVHTLAARQ